MFSGASTYNTMGSESDLLERGLAELRRHLGSSWNVSPHQMGTSQPANLPGPSEVDGVITIADPGGRHSPPVLIEVKTSLRPNDVVAHLEPRVRLMRSLTGDAAVLVISPWLSPQTRHQLDGLGYGYLDFTGNVSFRLNQPGVVIKLQGASKNPSGGVTSTQSGRGFRGEKAGALIRALVDVVPPYGVSELAVATQLSQPYVSRLLETLEAEGFVRRSKRVVVEVQWEQLLRARSATYQLLKANPPSPFVAPHGVTAVLDRLRELPDSLRKEYGPLAVTGHVAADLVAPLAVGGQLMVHVSNLAANLTAVRKKLDLLPHAGGGSPQVLLLDTQAASVFVGETRLYGLPCVALSQLALDCLGGNGRMPASGEAVLERMTRTENQWRLPDLQTWAAPRL